MFVSPTVRFPGNRRGGGSGNGGGRRSSSDERLLADKTYFAAAAAASAYDGHSHTGHFGGIENTRSRSWSGVLPFSTAKPQAFELYYLHPHWRAIMGEEAWYQSISDFEEGNYFNSPHLQHGRHGHSVAIEDEDSMDGIISMATCMPTVKAVSEPYHLHDDDPYFSTDPMMQSSHEHLPTTWPVFSPDGAPEVEQEMFANIDINRDLEHLVSGPMTDLGGLTSSPPAQEMLQPQAPITMHMHGHHFPSPAASPMTSTASMEEDMSSAYSPGMASHAAYAPYVMGEAAMLRPALRGSSWSSSLSPLRHERSHHQPLRRVRKSLPSSPMRGIQPGARSASFGEAASPASVASSVRCGSPAAGREHRGMRMDSPSSTASPACFAGERASKDEFLVRSRRAGMTYRDIKLQGGFAEAESTLRGRYRMLTKSREERVRNPKWAPVDVVLLRKAVLKYCNGKDPVLVKVPWKEVARFIFDNGGTYLFGNATCRKKWDELASFGMDREVEEDEAVCGDAAQDGEGEGEPEDDEDDDDEEAVR